ncbi:MAG: hypothetical protein ACWA6U_07745 [Breznakibacter sp.]
MKRIYLTISATSVLIALLLSHFYRPYVYQTHFNDFGFADIIGSLFSVIGFCSLVWGIRSYSSQEKNMQIITTTIIYSFFWEFLGFLDLHGTFDWKDIWAGIISGLLTYILKELLDKRAIKGAEETDGVEEKTIRQDLK